MTDRVLFQMWSVYRKDLIERHTFYVEQAQKRLLEPLSQAAIEQDADDFANTSYQQMIEHANPHIHDEIDFVEPAWEAGIWRYELLNDLRGSVRLSIISGIFHTWEKNLRQWLVDEMFRWHRGNHAKNAIWKQPIASILEFLECFRWDVPNESFYGTLNACRLIVNVYKHGEGTSLNELASKYPQYVENPRDDAPWLSDDQHFSLIGHDDLKISDSDIQKFSEAIICFWEKVPENTFQSQIENAPDWFFKAIQRDANKITR